MRAEHLVESRYHVPVRVRAELPADAVRAALDPRSSVGAIGRLPIVVLAPPLGVSELRALLPRLLVEIVDLRRFYEPLDLRREEQARGHDFGRSIDEVVIGNQTLLGDPDQELVVFVHQVVDRAGERLAGVGVSGVGVRAVTFGTAGAAVLLGGSQLAL